MGKMFEKTSEFDFSHDIRLLAWKKVKKKRKKKVKTLSRKGS